MEKCNIYNCNIYEAQRYLKHKWVPIILYVLGKNNSAHFSDFLVQIAYISSKSLSHSLSLLLENDIIALDNNVYTLTTRGTYLHTIIILMSNYDYDV